MRKRNDSHGPLFLLLFLLVLCLGLIPGCVSVEKVGEFRDALENEDFLAAKVITDADIDLALALAEQVGDEAALMCYPALRDCINAFLTVRERAASDEAGIVTSYQRLRNVRLFVERDTAMCGRRLHLACSAMLSETRSILRRVIGVVGLR